MGNGANISTKNVSQHQYSSLKTSQLKKDRYEPNYRARLFKYYEYVIDKSNADEPFKDIKIVSNSSELKHHSPVKKIARE